MFEGRSKADFRARREMVGLTQQDIADALGVDVRSVKRWERPGDVEPPSYAWGALERFERMFDVNVMHVVDLAFEKVAEFDARSVELTVYRSQDDYDANGRDEGFFRFVNAVTFEVARLLDTEGVAVRFVYAEDASPTPR